MSDPVRIQRKRTKGWKMPTNTKYVGRPTIWANNFDLDDFDTAEECVMMFEHDLGKFSPERFERFISPLRGKNLACWCALDAPCHADVLLEFATATQSKENGE